MYITFEAFRSICRHNKGFGDTECNPICELRTPILKNLGSCRYTGKSVLCNEDNCPFVKAEDAPRTYLMEYACYNCSFTFNRRVPRGVLASGEGGECPQCGVKDYDSAHKTHKPMRFLIM